MNLSPKAKGLIIIIVFLALLLLPASYALIREYMLSKHDAKKGVPAMQHADSLKSE